MSLRRRRSAHRTVGGSTPVGRVSYAPNTETVKVCRTASCVPIRLKIYTRCSESYCPLNVKRRLVLSLSLSQPVVYVFICDACTEWWWGVGSNVTIGSVGLRACRPEFPFHFTFLTIAGATTSRCPGPAALVTLWPFRFCASVLCEMVNATIVTTSTTSDNMNIHVRFTVNVMPFSPNCARNISLKRVSRLRTSSSLIVRQQHRAVQPRFSQHPLVGE